MVTEQSVASIRAVIENNPVRLKEYQDRVQYCNETLDSLGRGARAQLARDIRISPASVSSALNGGRIALGTIMLIEDWLAEVLPFVEDDEIEEE